MMAQSSGMDTVAYYAFPENTWLPNTSGTNVQGIHCTVDYTGVGNKESNAQIIDGIYYLKFTSNTSYVKLKPSNGDQVKPGDSVFVTLGHSSKRELGAYLKTQGTGTWISATQSANNEIVVAKAKLTRDDINDDGTLSFYRKDGNTTFVRSFLVTRDPNAPVATHNFITYYDQNGVKLGIDSVAVGVTSWSFKYGEADLPSYPDAMKYRGWYTANGRRVAEGETLEGDLVVYALVTAIEYPTSTARYIYDLTNEYFYQDDHECISITGAAYSAADKGWKCENNAVVKLTVSPTVYVSVNGKEPELYTGESTLTLSYGQDYILKTIAIYNVTDKVQKENGYYQIPAGDANSLLMVLNQVQAGDKIFLPNGVYDFGTLTLTEINKNNISIIGQSTEGVIIKNAPLTAHIGTTATLRITKNTEGTYLQDLTIQNEFDYYKANEGQAVTLWDQGTKTVCKNVRLLSYQDTYYSNLKGAVKYFEDCEIHGTVDFICGDGSVYFKRALLYGEKRYKTGGGSIALTANNGVATDKGYVFDSCTVMSECPVVSLGRAWNETPQATFLNTTIDYSAGQFGFSDSKTQRWTIELMNATTLWPIFGEYNTRTTEGELLTPASNVVPFRQKNSTVTNELETVLSAEQAAAFTMDYTLGSWSATAAADATQAECEKMAADFEPNGIYLVEGDGEFAGIILGSEFMDKFAMYNGVKYTVRKANARGGFGAPVNGGETGIENTAVEAKKAIKMIREGNVYILRDGKTFNVLGVEIR